MKVTKVTEEILSLHERIGWHCGEIRRMFKPGAKVTVIVRNPESDISATDEASVMVSDDEPLMIIGAIKHLASKDVILPGESVSRRVQQ